MIKRRSIAWFYSIIVAALCVIQAAISVRAVDLATLPTKQLSIPTDPRTLPYRFVLSQEMHAAGLAEGEQHLVDVDGDGYAELYYWYSVLVDSSHYKSALVVEPHDLEEGPPVQYNGPLLSCAIWNCVSMDVMGGPGDDVVLTRQYRDTIFLEMVSFCLVHDTLSIDTEVIFSAAVARAFPSRQYWHSIHVVPLASIDVNGDGVRDLVYSRSVKPDSAFERSIVAYDFVHDRPIWAFQVADLVSTGNLKVFVDAQHDSCLVCVIAATGNAYTANRMDSKHAYVLGLDLRGHELWRHTIGGAIYYPQLVSSDVNGDGFAEACVTCDPGYGAAGVDSLVRAYDPWTGDVVAAFAENDHGKKLAPVHITSFPDAIFVQWQDDSAASICRLAMNLEPVAIWTGSLMPGQTFRLAGAFDTLLLGAGADGRQVLLDRDLNPVAMCRSYSRHVDFGKTSLGNQFLFDRTFKDYQLASLRPESIWVRLYARYQFPLAALVSLVLLMALWRTVQTLRTWRHAALGIPTLSSINAMVLLIDRSGRLIYVNKHPLSERLIGPKLSRTPYQTSGLARFPEITDAIAQSFEEPLGVHKHGLELDCPGELASNLELDIYPFLDEHNSYRGKIVVVEELSGASLWKWKVVLGSAAQKWVHRLKHYLATMRTIAGNLGEDEVIASRLCECPELKDQWKSLEAQILEGSVAATKILRYLKNPRPQLVDCDINGVIQLLVSAKRPTWQNRIELVLSLQDAIPLARVDPDQVREVFDNLLSNAAQAIPGTGRITVSTRVKEDLQNGTKRRTVEIAVDDTGVGIASEDISRVFAPDFSKSVGGTGIGLALVKEIIDNHRGEITITSQVGEGTSVVISLPLKGIEA